MDMDITIADDEAEIRELFMTWTNAVRARDLDGVMSHYAADVIAFDAILQLQFKGRDTYREHWRACLAMCPGEMIFDVRDLKVAVGGDIAFAHGLTRCGVLDGEGGEKASWMRGTTCYRRTNGSWTIVHEHWSAPFEMETGKALFELTP
jgi:uncharacterized protein (TIGR02246 family)